MSEQPELLMDSNTQYPDDWPLSSTPLPVPGEGLGGVTTPTGVSTPPLQQLQTAQQTPPLSITTSRLRQSSSVRSSPHRKRLSLSFPVQPAARQVPSAYALPYTPTSPDADLPTPVVSVDFLTVLAAQERRVLELKEELQKAETELSTLKRQWAIHEATKKRHELFQTEARGGSDGEIGGIMSPTLDEQQAKRKAALLKLTQASTRSVSSQRHHRTLSLLSPQRTSYSQPFPQPKDICDNDTDSVRSAAPQRRSDSFPLPRPISMIETSSLALKRNSQDVLLRTGKQMAEGFKEGLWAFVEDLRQATVGEDTRPREAPNSRSGSSLGAPSHNLRKQGSKSSLRSVSSSGTGRRERSPLKSTTESSTPTADSWQAISRASNDDDSSTISPSARWSTSTTLSDIGASSSATPSRSSTPRTSTRYKVFAYLLSLLRPANIYHQLGPIFYFNLRTSPARTSASAQLGICHVSIDTV